MGGKKKMEQTVREFNIGQLLPIGLTFVVLGIALSYGLNVMEDVQTDLFDADQALTNQSAAWNGSTDSITGVNALASKQSLIVTVVVAAVIIGILITYMVVRMRG